MSSAVQYNTAIYTYAYPSPFLFRGDKVDVLRTSVLYKVSNAQLERETADRRSLAGMALAHADASTELRARLSSAVQALEASEVGNASPCIAVYVFLI